MPTFQILFIQSDTEFAVFQTLEKYTYVPEAVVLLNKMC